MEHLALLFHQILENIINNYSDEIANAIFICVISVIGYVINNVKNSYLKSALESAEKGVLIIQNTVVEDLKEKSKDGKLTAEEKEEVKLKAIKIAKQQLGIVGTMILNIFTGSAEKWIATQVEYIVARVKQASNSADNK